MWRVEQALSQQPMTYFSVMIHSITWICCILKSLLVLLRIFKASLLLWHYLKQIPTKQGVEYILSIVWRGRSRQIPLMFSLVTVYKAKWNHLSPAELQVPWSGTAQIHSCIRCGSLEAEEENTRAATSASHPWGDVPWILLQEHREGV